MHQLSHLNDQIIAFGTLPQPIESDFAGCPLVSTVCDFEIESSTHFVDQVLQHHAAPIESG